MVSKSTKCVYYLLELGDLVHGLLCLHLGLLAGPLDRVVVLVPFLLVDGVVFRNFFLAVAELPWHLH